MKLVQLLVQLVQSVPGSVSFLIIKGIDQRREWAVHATVGELYCMLKRMEVPYREHKVSHDEDTVSRRYN